MLYNAVLVSAVQKSESLYIYITYTLHMHVHMHYIYITHAYMKIHSNDLKIYTTNPKASTFEHSTD